MAGKLSTQDSNACGYASPEESILDVVTHWYWPFDRWHSFP
ncbi:MAG: hypothetical protein VW875_11070 [Planctomycetaceae bacterium]